MLEALGIIAFAYFLGAVPTGFWVAKILKGIDLRKEGSGSTGATNVLRCVGKGPALFVMLFDMAKGWFPVWLTIVLSEQIIDGSASQQVMALVGNLKVFGDALPWLATVVAIVTMVGHSKSIFLGFQGGKSAATGLGTIAGFNWVAGAVLFGSWALIVYVGRIVSLASIVAGILTPLYMWLFTAGNPVCTAYGFLSGFYVVIRHISNIKRLLNGTEPKFGQKASDKQINKETGTKSETGTEKTGGTPSANCILAFLLAASLLAQAQAQPKTASKPAGKTPVWSQSKAPATPGLTAEEQVNIKVYKTVNQGVVNITASAMVSPEMLIFGVTPQAGTGSGSIISPDGYVLTNNHVIGGANMVKVTLYDGTAFAAQVVGCDPDNDLAVLKIDPGNKVLTPVKFGDSSRLEVGRRVYAIGNPFGLDLTMTSGIISNIGRTLKTETGRLIKGVIQTDAAINPGNSGGPLLNSGAEMIGVTTAIFSRAGQSAGIGFAIPINIVKRIVPQLIQHKRVLRPDLGILSVRPTGVGLMISQLLPDGPAAQAGLKGQVVRVQNHGGFVIQSIDTSEADIIVNIDKQPVRSVDDLLSYIESKKPGQVVKLDVLRRGKVVEIPVKLTSTPGS